MATKIQLLHDDESTWNSKNPVLDNGEIAVVHRSNGTTALKAGDGITNFKGLNYIGSDYVLVDVDGTTSSGYVLYALQDKAINRIVINSNASPIRLRMPQSNANSIIPRDFIVRIECYCETPPEASVVGYRNENIEYECPNEEWLVLESGVTMLSFTEMSRV